MRRSRAKKARPGQLIGYFGYGSDGDGPDLCAAWGGDGASKSDGHLLIAALGGKIFDYPIFYRELEKRGYDLSTMKFTIELRSSDKRG